MSRFFRINKFLRLTLPQYLKSPNVKSKRAKTPHAFIMPISLTCLDRLKDLPSTYGMNIMPFDNT